MMNGSKRWIGLLFMAGLCLAGFQAFAQQTVYVSRMWHNHQPLYWPEWNANGSETGRVQYAWDSIVLKPGQTYGTGTGHPDNNLSDIFGLDDRRNAYQGRPRDSLAAIDSSAGFCMSYSGALIDNIRNLAANTDTYDSGWWDGNRQSRNWLTPSGSRRMDLVGFTYHHSLGPLLPKEVFRKELQIFKQAYWKAWGGSSDLSDHSKGFFPTEMAFSESMIDVLADEGYEWSIVASHHLSRTCPTYFDQFDLPNSYGIFSSPPNKADRLGPSPTAGWWYGEPNPGNAAWNVAPYAYQLHKARYVNPETGLANEILLVPSDDVLSYRFGYANEGVGKIQNNIAPYATDPTRPVMVMPATDGDNAWGGGYSSWMEATPQFFNDSASAGYARSAVQDFVDAHGAAADTVHVEDGAWIFPESDYGSPYFLKWIEPPLKPGSASAYPGTIVDLETPGFALKFWSWAPVITGANWCETAEQMLIDEGGSVNAWKIQAPYEWSGAWSSPNDVELAWHIYLGGLDSGFNYYGGLGNDDEVKQSLATTRAIEKLSSFVNSRLTADPTKDLTPPTVLRPQRFPWNPGGYTFGWFNSIPGGDENYLKAMPSEFYIWTHAYDLSDIISISVKIRQDDDGVNSMANDQNETYAGGSDVGVWMTISMTKRVLPNTRSELNAAANNGDIDYFITPPELADYYFAKITDDNVAGFRDKLLDYYIEAADGQGNVSKSEIQHVFVEDDGIAAPGQPTNVSASAISSTQITVSWDAVAGAGSYIVKRDGAEVGSTTATNFTDEELAPSTAYLYTLVAHNAAGDSDESVSASATTWDPPTMPDTPAGLSAAAVSSEQVNLSWNPVSGEAAYIIRRDGTPVGIAAIPSYSDTGLMPSTTYSYTVAASNSAGLSAASSQASATTQEVPQDFVMDGSVDYAGYWVLNSNMTLYAAVRGSRLYVAMSSPAGAANDHFILITDTLLPSATDVAPWAKAGTIAVAANKPFLAGESSNGWAGWFNVAGGSELFNLSGGQLEGSIDLGAVFGSVPPTIYLAALTYQTSDGGALVEQAPAGNGDGNVDPSEVIAFPLEALRDSLANGTFDRLDPARGFIISDQWNVSNNPVLAWPCVPGRIYQAEYGDSLTNGWQSLGDPVQAASGQDSLSIPDPSAGTNSQRFYRARLINP
jgi:hypothetical protein